MRFSEKVSQKHPEQYLLIKISGASDEQVFYLSFMCKKTWLFFQSKAYYGTKKFVLYFQTKKLLKKMPPQNIKKSSS